MFRSDGDRRSFSLTRDITVIGRREDCDLRIPLGDVSRKHCRLVRDGDSIRLEDLGSSNGTYHNAQRVQEAILSPGDSIQVGPLVFVLQVDGVPADDELAPVTVGGVEESHEAALLDDSPLQPTAQSEVSLEDELPTLDQGLDDELEPIESLEADDSLDEAEPLAHAEPLGELEPLEDANLPGQAGGAGHDNGVGPHGGDEHGMGTPRPLGLEAPAGGGEDLDFDDLIGSELSGAAPAEAHPGQVESAAHDNGAAAAHDEPLAIDDLDQELEPLELDEDEHDINHPDHEPLKVDSEHESPHPH